MQICDIAIVDYFTKNIPIKETINNCNDIFKFQIITKTGSSYNHTLWQTPMADIEVQKINRVYAIKDKSYGNLYKTKFTNDRLRKDSVANCPEHCYVDNNNKLTIDEIDKNWYIDIVNKRIKDYLGE